MDEITNQPVESIVERVLKEETVVEIVTHPILLSANGNQYMIESSAAPIKNEHGEVRGVVIVFRDYTDKNEKQKQIEYLSYHDYLTGLYNRRYIDMSLELLDKEEYYPLSIINVDVNGLKMINDSFGHNHGDELLKAVASVLKKSCRATDLIGRIGGDEFIVVLTKANETIAKRVCEQIKNNSLTQTIGIATVSVSVGFATKTKENENMEDIKRRADEEMYRDKAENGKQMRIDTINLLLDIVDEDPLREVKREYIDKICSGFSETFNNKELEECKKTLELLDIGKVVLQIDKKDSDDEWDNQKRYTEISYQLAKAVDDYRDIAENMLHINEKWDGSGIPTGLKQKSIPLKSRLLAIINTYLEMKMDFIRVNDNDDQEIFKVLENGKGTFYDPTLVDDVITVIKKYK